MATMTSFREMVQHTVADDGTAEPRLDRGIFFGLTGAVLLLHVLLSGRYAYFRDELYFLDCGRNLAWGYVDMAPMIAFVARLALALGGSLPVLRTIAAAPGSPVRPPARGRGRRGGRRGAGGAGPRGPGGCEAVLPGCLGDFVSE